MRSTTVAAAGVVAIVSLGQAQANTIFDSYVGGSYSNAYDSSSNAVAAMGVSFNAAGSSFNQINVQVSAPTGSSGSTKVYLVPDNGGLQGVAGNASTIFGPSVTPASLASTHAGNLLTTIQDSSLGANPALYSIQVSNIPTSSNGEYWLVLIPSGGLQWWYAQPNTVANVETNGVGLTSQRNTFYNTAATTSNAVFGWNVTSDIGSPIGGPDDYGPYAFQVLNNSTTDAPEPASVAILGSALVGAGVLRRRARRNAA